MIDIPPHPIASFWLDVADKAIKFTAVFIGGFWTIWNFRKSRTYEQRLELEVVGEVYSDIHLYGDIKVSVKNIGATKHPVSPKALSVHCQPCVRTFQKNASSSSKSLKKTKELSPENQSTTRTIGELCMIQTTSFG